MKKTKILSSNGKSGKPDKKEKFFSEIFKFYLKVRKFLGKRQGKSDLKMIKTSFLGRSFIEDHNIPTLRKNVNCHRILRGKYKLEHTPVTSIQFLLS